MPRIETGQRGVEALPASVDPGLRPGMRHEHVAGTGKAVGIGQPVDDARGHAESAAHRGEQHGVFGAIALRLARDLQRRGIAHAEVLVGDEAAHEALHCEHAPFVAFDAAGRLLRQRDDFRRRALQPVVGSVVRGFRRTADSASRIAIDFDDEVVAAAAHVLLGGIRDIHRRIMVARADRVAQAAEQFVALQRARRRHQGALENIRALVRCGRAGLVAGQQGQFDADRRHGQLVHVAILVDPCRVAHQRAGEGEHLVDPVQGFRAARQADPLALADRAGDLDGVEAGGLERQLAMLTALFEGHPEAGQAQAFGEQGAARPVRFALLPVAIIVDAQAHPVAVDAPLDARFIAAEAGAGGKPQRLAVDRFLARFAAGHGDRRAGPVERDVEALLRAHAAVRNMA